VARGWLSTKPSLDSAEKETDKLILGADRGLVENLRYEGIGKPLGLGAVIVSPPLSTTIIRN
jgi:charged multivesicular body protein 7